MAESYQQQGGVDGCIFQTALDFGEGSDETDEARVSL